MMIFLLGGVVFLLGVALLVFAIRGRLVSDHPHCRGCKFDLHECTLVHESVCPNCNQPTIPNTPLVLNGLRKKRVMVIVLSALLMFVGVGGLAWPRISQIPAIKNFDIYTKYSEKKLITLAIKNDERAIKAIHTRLIPGDVSDAGLQRLIVHALEELADETSEWNEQWGDVLLYAFLEGKLGEAQFIEYAERSVNITAQTHTEVGMDLQNLRYYMESKRPVRGQSSYGFRTAFAQAQSGNTTNRDPESPYKFEMNTYTPRVKGSTKPTRSNGGWTDSSFTAQGSTGWIPFNQHSSGLGSNMRFPFEQDTTILEFVINCSITKNEQPVHEWEFIIEKTIVRKEHPVYAISVSDLKTLAPAIELCQISPIIVPRDLHLIEEHPELENEWLSMFTLKSGLDFTLMGQVWFRVDGEEVLFSNVRVRPDIEHRFGNQNAKGYHNKWWAYFTDHEAFWDRAVEKGTIDIIIRPDLELAKNYYEVDTVIDHPVIFRDVPIKLNTPSPASWSPRGQDPKYEWERTGMSMSATEEENVKAEPFQDQ